MSERKDPTPAALYARVSSDRQDVDLSVAAQLRALRDYASLDFTHFQAAQAMESRSE